jgi:sec-independent protein translocase protein TatB
MFPEGRLLDFLIVGAVALVVVGPKDLPILMRKVGQFMGRMRGMAAEFRASFDELARQSELDALRKEVEALRTTRPADFAAKAAAEAGMPEMFTDLHAEIGAANDEIRTALRAPEAPAPTASETPPTDPPPAEPPAIEPKASTT